MVRPSLTHHLDTRHSIELDLDANRSHLFRWLLFYSMSLYKRQYPKQVEYFTPPPAGKHVGAVEELEDEVDEMDVE